MSTVLSFVKRRPRPSCCTETVALSVGRRNHAPQRVERAARRSVAGVSADTAPSPDAHGDKLAGQIAGMLDADAETQRTHRGDIGHLVTKFLEQRSV